MATYTTLPFRTQAGEFTFSFIGPGATNRPVEIETISPLKYDFEISNKDGLIDSVGFRMGSVDVVFFDDIGLNESLHQLLFSEVIDRDFAALTWKTPLGDEYRTRFEYQQQNIKTDYRERKTTIQFNPVRREDATMEDFFTSAAHVEYPTGFAFIDTDIDSSTDNFNGVMAGRFIQSCLLSMDPELTTADLIVTSGPSVAPSNATLSLFEVDLPANDTTDALVICDTAPVDGELDKTMTECLVEMAVMEGAFFGVAFGKGFYMSRIPNTPLTTEIDYNEVELLSFSVAPNILNSVIMTLEGRVGGTPPPTYPNLSFATTGFLRPRTRQRDIGIKRTVAAPFLNKVRYTGVFFEGRPVAAGPQTNHLENGLVKAGGRVYTRTFGAQLSRRIEIKIWGMNRIKPWEAFEFGSNAPAEFADITWRPSSLRYDIMEDTITIEAYDITSDGAYPNPFN